MVGPMLVRLADVTSLYRVQAATSALRCVDEIEGVHAQEWIERRTSLPPTDAPFQVRRRSTSIDRLID